MSATRSIIITPVPADRDAQHNRSEGETKLSLFVEPDEDIVILGLMMGDVKILGELLQTLPFGSVDSYRGNLRVIAGAADRLRRRAAKLLGEDKP